MVLLIMMNPFNYNPKMPKGNISHTDVFICTH